MKSMCLVSIILALSVIVLSGCSDSSTVQGVMKGDYALVMLDLDIQGESQVETAGLVDKVLSFFTLSSTLEASSPSDITTITATITGPGMSPVNKTLPSSGMAVLLVPAGESRLISVTCNTSIPVRNYEGSMMTSLSGGQVAPVTIAMSEVITGCQGSPASPFFLPATMGGATYQLCYVDTGISYYYTTELGSDHYVSVLITEMSDDVDAVSYGVDDSFTSVDFKPSHGRKRDEGLGYSQLGTNNFYFTIDGSCTGYHTRHSGGTYTITVSSSSPGMAMPWCEGSSDQPKFIQAGCEYSGQVNDNCGTSYYYTTVKPGTSRFNLNSSSYTPQVYSDRFVTPSPDQVTFISEMDLYFTVHSDSGDGYFSLEVVTAEGSILAPVYLFPNKTNFCQNLNSSSYYIFEVTPGANYEVMCESISHGANLYVYEKASFTSLIGSDETADTNKTITGMSSPNGILAVRVSDTGGVGNTFELTVE